MSWPHHREGYTLCLWPHLQVFVAVLKRKQYFKNNYKTISSVVYTNNKTTTTCSVLPSHNAKQYFLLGLSGNVLKKVLVSF